jgi:hypothetical protein
MGWGEKDDVLLANLFRTKKIDYRKTDRDTIKAALKHFPDATYANFAPLYKRKANKWSLGEALTGKRRGPSQYYYSSFTTLIVLVFLFSLFFWCL